MKLAESDKKPSIFTYRSACKHMTTKEEKEFWKNTKDVLNKSLNYVGEKDKHGLRLINQIVDYLKSPRVLRVINSGYMEPHFDVWNELADDRRLGTIIDTLETDVDTINKKLDVIEAIEHIEIK